MMTQSRLEGRMIGLALVLGLSLIANVAFGATPERAGPLHAPLLRDAYACEGAGCYEPQPPGSFVVQAMTNCDGFEAELASPFAGDGYPIIGVRWWGAYQHPPGEEPPPVDYFRIDIRPVGFQGCPDDTGQSWIVVDFNESRFQSPDPSFTIADYCCHLDGDFITEPGVEYALSITAHTCTHYQWWWFQTDQPGPEACFRSSSLGYTDWVPVTEAFGEPFAMSWAFICPEAVIDITKSVPGWWPAFGNTTTYTARTYWRDPRSGTCSFPGPEKLITFTLSGVSTEKGYSLNMGTRDALDLHMNHASNSEFSVVARTVEACDLVNGTDDHWTSVTTIDCRTEATVTVVSEDYGAYGYIEASGDGCNPVPVSTILPREPGGGTTCTPGPAKTKIPRDDNGNDIEDMWWGDATNGTSPTWDEEGPATTPSKGDGLTRYEEWRGLHAMGVHRRLLTLTKELMVSRENPAWGAEDMTAVAVVHFVTPAEMNGRIHDPGPGTVNPAKGPRIINFNRTSHTKVDQHGLWLAVGAGGADPGEWGEALTNTGGLAGPIGPPRTAGRIRVFNNRITQACAARGGRPFRYRNPPRRRNAVFSFDASARANEFISDTIGHELAHGTGLEHHAGRWLRVRHAPGFGADGWIDVNSRPRTVARTWTSGANQRNCVMNYPYQEIRQSVALRLVPVVGAWTSRDHDWSPTLPTCLNGYGTTCSVPGHNACVRNVTIDDAD